MSDWKMLLANNALFHAEMTPHPPFPPPPPHWTLNEHSIVKRLCFNVMVKLYARAKWMVSAAATDISTSCAVETDSVGVGSLECVGAQYHTICIDNITSFILDPTPPPPTTPWRFLFPPDRNIGFSVCFLSSSLLGVRVSFLLQSYLALRSPA